MTADFDCSVIYVVPERYFQKEAHHMSDTVEGECIGWMELRADNEIQSVGIAGIATDDDDTILPIPGPAFAEEARYVLVKQDLPEEKSGDD